MLPNRLAVRRLIPLSSSSRMLSAVPWVVSPIRLFQRYAPAEIMRRQPEGVLHIGPVSPAH